MILLYPYTARQMLIISPHLEGLGENFYRVCLAVQHYPLAICSGSALYPGTSSAGPVSVRLLPLL